MGWKDESSSGVPGPWPGVEPGPLASEARVLLLATLPPAEMSQLDRTRSPTLTYSIRPHAMKPTKGVLWISYKLTKTGKRRRTAKDVPAAAALSREPATALLRKPANRQATTIVRRVLKTC